MSFLELDLTDGSVLVSAGKSIFGKVEANQ